FLGGECAVDENRLQHSGHAGEKHQVGLGDGAIERAKALSEGELLPGESEAERLHTSLSKPSSAVYATYGTTSSTRRWTWATGSRMVEMRKVMRRPPEALNRLMCSTHSRGEP